MRLWPGGGGDAGTAPFAVIDIGSNSIRLVVYDGLHRSATQLYNEKLFCGLGRHLATTGRLAEKPMARALTALRRFHMLAVQAGARRIEVIATAAARDAINGPDFIARAQAIMGLPVRVLSGDEEAVFAAAGVAAGFADMSAIAGDLGGGSLELVDVDGDRPRKAISVPLGALRLLDASGGSLTVAAEIIDAELARIPWLDAGAGRPFIVIGGGWRALARIDMLMRAYPLSVLHHYELALDAPEKLLAALIGKTARELKSRAHVDEERVETLPFACLVLQKVAARLEPSEILVSAYGVREGLHYSLLADAEQRRDPLLQACRAIAAAQARSLAHADELCDFADAFLAAAPREDSGSPRLRRAACLLSDIAWRAHPDFRGEQAMSLVAQSSLTGLTHPERVFLALTLFHRHEGGREDGGNGVAALLDRRGRFRARLLALVLRLAYILSAGQPGVLPAVSLRLEETRVVLTLPDTLAGLDGERVRRRLKTLATALGRQPELRIGAGTPPRLRGARVVGRV